MKKYLILAILGAFLLGGLPLIANSTQKHSNPVININNDNLDQVEYDTDGNNIVYTTKQGNEYSLYIYNVITQEEKLIAKQTDDLFQPTIDDGRVVWVKKKQWNKKIVMYDSNNDSLVDITDPSNYLNDTQPYIQDDKISFVRWQYSAQKASAYVYNIENKTATALDPQNKTWQTNITHYNNYIVWQDNRNDIDEIFLYDLTKKESVNLSNNGLNHYFPNVYGDYVAWQSQNGIYVKNIKTGSLKVLGGKDYSNWSIDINQNNVVYQSWRDGSHNIYLYNTLSQTETKVTQTYADDEQPKIYGDIIVWKQKTANGTYDIVYQNIKPIIEKMYTQLAFETKRANEVKITWPDINNSDYYAYNLYRSTIAGDRGQLIAHNIIGNQYIDSNLTPDITYFYSLYIVNNQGIQSNYADQFSYKAKQKKLVKTPESSAVYLIDGNKSYIIENEQTFREHNFNWQQIETINKNQLDQYNYQGPLLLPSGTVVKTSGPAVYLIYNNNIKAFVSGELFKRSGYKWEDIIYLTPSQINVYKVGEMLTLDNFKHPDGSLIKYSNDSAVYFIENGKKRVIPNEFTFQANNFSWDDVIISPTYWQYPDGPSL